MSDHPWLSGRWFTRADRTERKAYRADQDRGPARASDGPTWTRGWSATARARFAWDCVKRERREEERMDAEYQQQMDEDIADETRRGLRSTFGHEYDWGNW